MITLSTLNSCEWQLHKKIDKVVAEAALGYLRKLTTRRIPINIQQLSNELDESRLGREPDYDTPGLPLVYAFKYMPRRIVSIFGSLISVLDGWHPKSVLDVGSGTGATAMAIDLLDLPHHVDLLGIEPNLEMILFSECFECWHRVSTLYRQGSIDNLAKDIVSFVNYDLVVFSACFPYEFDNWNPLITTLGDYEGQESKMILAIEPDAKADLLMSFQHGLRTRGWPTTTFCCHDLPDVIKDNSLPLPKMLSVWRRLHMDDSSQPKTWWNPPNDLFLEANPKPVQPCNQQKVLSSLSMIEPLKS
jgi:hypothetical protein